jgi:ankyrin repeat protein
MFGGIDELKQKLRKDKKKLRDIMDMKNANDETLLEMALSYRKFELAKFLLSNGAKVNNISKDGYNEFHYLAANLHFDGALECAQLLLEKGVDLSVQDHKYENTAMFSLCLEALKHPSPTVCEFICACFTKKQGIDEKNIRGNTVRMMVEARGAPEMKTFLN